MVRGGQVGSWGSDGSPGGRLHGRWGRPVPDGGRALDGGGGGRVWIPHHLCFAATCLRGESFKKIKIVTFNFHGEIIIFLLKQQHLFFWEKSVFFY